jgi:hypothetical protein
MKSEVSIWFNSNNKRMEWKGNKENITTNANSNADGI